MGELNDPIFLIIKDTLRLRPFLYYLWSTDGIHFKKDEGEINLKENISSCENFRVSVINDKNLYVLTYIRRAKNKQAMLVVAHSKDLYNWKVVEEFEAKDSHTAFIIKNKDNPTTLYRDGLFISAENLDEKHTMRRLLFTSRHNFFDDEPLYLIDGEVTDHGNLLFYDASFYDRKDICLQSGVALVDPRNQNVLWRSDVPVSQMFIETTRVTSFYTLGGTVKNGTIFLYYKVGDEIVVSSFPSPFKDLKIYHTPQYHVPILKKHHKNPILSPQAHNEWESEAVFNPAAIYEEGRVHLLYRALGPRGISVLGYASSYDGSHIDERHQEPAYYPRERFEGANVAGPSSFTDLYASGGGWGGCEDPKLTCIGKKIYLTYVAFNGWSQPRLAISWIKKDDFLNKKWKWSQPKLMSRPGIVDKSGCVLPEKINGKDVVFHRVFPDILIDFVDDLDFGEGKWLRGEFKISPRPLMWDSRKLSVGAPPIKTKEGWLVIYHAVDDRDDGKYKIGAMLLDLKNPTKVLHRTNVPILVPDMHYENEGKSGVAYPCGAVIIGKDLHVYYGGGDRVVCVASTPVEKLLHHLIEENPNPFALTTEKNKK